MKSTMTIEDAIAAYEAGGAVAQAKMAEEAATAATWEALDVLHAASKVPQATIQDYVRAQLARQGLTAVGVRCCSLVRFNRPTVLLVTVEISLHDPGRLVDQWTSDRVETLSEWCARIGKIGADLMESGALAGGLPRFVQDDAQAPHNEAAIRAALHVAIRAPGLNLK